MLIPWGTDAPIYHRPIATITLIAVNVVACLLFPPGLDPDWTLVLGDGIHPLQWVTNIFLHLGFGHLLGNMLFLWAFGIIVEGKLGWLGFTFVYFCLGILESALFQLLIRPDEPVRLVGASGVIFGLLAMCVVWAPRNELQCIFLFRVIPVDFDLPILSVAGFYIGMEVLFLGLKGLAISSELAHCAGAVLGFVLGVVLLKNHWVDCENWDLFAVLEGRQGQSKKAAMKAKTDRRVISSEFQTNTPNNPKRKAAKKKDGTVRSVEDIAAARLRALRLHLEMGEVEAALAVYTKAIRSINGWQPPEPDWIDLIEGLLEQRRWDDAVAVMRDYHRLVPEPAPRILLKLAQVLIEKLSRPLQARKILAQIPAGAVAGDLQAMRRDLIRQADRMTQDEDGPLELQDEMW